MSQKPKNITISADLVLPTETVERIAASVDGNESESRKVVRVGLGLLQGLADGGVMMPALQVRRVVDAAGKDLDAQEIADLAERGAGRQGGLLVIPLRVDPSYEALLQQVADFQGSDIAQVLQNALDTAWDDGWLYADSNNRVARVLMTDRDKAALVKVLGKDFSNGTELAAHIRDLVGGDLFDTAEEAKPVAEESTAAVVRRSRTIEEWESLSPAEKQVELARMKNPDHPTVKAGAVEAVA